jgi:hypothetical protein
MSTTVGRSASILFSNNSLAHDWIIEYILDSNLHYYYLLIVIESILESTRVKKKIE